MCDIMACHCFGRARERVLVILAPSLIAQDHKLVGRVCLDVAQPERSSVRRFAEPAVVREDEIQGITHERRQQLALRRRVHPQRRVAVDFDQPGRQVFIDHEV